ncbi:SCP2 domain-containing protein [Agaribacterium sp. ZY112]|uniref:ubiquinone anaerobic biosynthesis accessory factor UbiT n=1 Tax=Agaribacterium sp. ZY112 TaxID=3233574 RepID=UPI003525DE24
MSAAQTINSDEAKMGNGLATKPSEGVKKAPVNTIADKLMRFAKKIKPLQRASKPALSVLHAAPFPVQKKLIESLLNDALITLIDDGELDFLQEKSCAIRLEHSNLSWVLSFDGARLCVLNQADSDVCISATSVGFLKLMSQSVDPDTLFFERELLIEGDTALGLNIKNLLDALDYDELPKRWAKALSSLRYVLKQEL